MAYLGLRLADDGGLGRVAGDWDLHNGGAGDGLVSGDGRFNRHGLDDSGEGEGLADAGRGLGFGNVGGGFGLGRVRKSRGSNNWSFSI